MYYWLPNESDFWRNKHCYSFDNECLKKVPSIIVLCYKEKCNPLTKKQEKKNDKGNCSWLKNNTGQTSNQRKRITFISSTRNSIRNNYDKIKFDPMERIAYLCYVVIEMKQLTVKADWQEIISEDHMNEWESLSTVNL